MIMRPMKAPMPMPAFALLERVEAEAVFEVCEGELMNGRVSEGVLNEVGVVREEE